MSSRRKGASSAQGRRNPIPPPLEQGWQWQSRPASRLPVPVEPDDVEDDDVVEECSDEDDLPSDEFDSDSSQRSHNSLRKSKWFEKFVRTVEELTVEEVNDPERQWHCAACQGGPGAIDWYHGLQPLMAHAKTKGGGRMRHHRALARLLSLELQHKGTRVVPPSEALGQWKGLLEDTKDHQIVWPPMVVVMNTKLEQDPSTDKWTGMGNQELLAYFEDYTPDKARHSYGPQGHRGMSLLTFEASARGYLEAERLDKHFLTQGTDRHAWQTRRVLFYPGGKRQLYGFLATKQDIDLFNQHSQGKSRIKFDLKSYHEMVVKEIRQMSEDNQQLTWFKDKYSQEKRHSKAVEETLHTVSAKLQLKEEESRIVRLRTKLQHQENQEEMYLQEEFFKEQIKIIHETRDANDESFEKIQQEERAKVESSGKKRSAKIESQNKEMEDYSAQRETLEREHEEKKKAVKKRHWEEEVALEEELSANLTRLMNKYNPNASVPRV